MPKLTAAAKVENHHSSDVKDWKAFEKNFRSKAFKKAVEIHPASDDKLKRYVAANHKYRNSRKPVDTAMSSTGQKAYEIRVLKDGALGCGCKDWQYKKSHGGKDCKHIATYRAANHQTPPIKVASIIAGANLARQFGKAEDAMKKGKKMEENRKRLHRGEPLQPL